MTSLPKALHDHVLNRIVDTYGMTEVLNDEGGPFAGLDRFDARTAVKEKLAELGLDRGSKEHVMALPRSQRSGVPVEPMLSTQWFVRMEELAGPAIEAIESGRTRFVPKNWENTYFSWMRNIQDWCISRQLWWGHRIPAWFCHDCGEISVAREDISTCQHCNSTNIHQDEDVLDTWFSSALWAFSTFGWPEDTESLKKYYPTSVLMTGFDIIFFWVARMMFSGLYFQDEVPFKDILHDFYKLFTTPAQRNCVVMQVSARIFQFPTFPENILFNDY